MRALWRLLLTALPAIMLVSACAGGPTATPGQATPGQATPASTLGEVEFRLRGSSNVGADTSFGRSYDSFADCLNERTNGRVELEIFHAAQLGSDAEALELAQTGALDFTATTLFSNVIPVATVFDLPFLFRDIDHWQRATQGAPGDTIREAGLPVGIRILSYDLGGWRDIYSNTQVNSAEDLRGLRLRTLQSPAYVELFQELGAVPTPLAFGEVYLALQQGTLDGAETALPSMYDANQHEVTQYVAQTHHGLSSVAWTVSESVWTELPTEIQGAIMSCDEERIEQQVREQLEDMERVDRVLQEDEGMTFTQPDPAPFRQAAEAVYERLITAEAQQQLLQQVLDLAEE